MKSKFIALATIIIIFAAGFISERAYFSKKKNTWFKETANFTVGSSQLSTTNKIVSTYEDDYNKISVSLDRTGNDSIDRAIEAWAQSILSERKEFDTSRMTEEEKTDRNSFGLRQYVLDLTGRSYSTSKWTSTLISSYEYTGGAHGNGTFYTKTFLNNGKELTLNEVLGGVPNYEKIATAVKPRLLAEIQKLSKENGYYEYYPDQAFNEGTEPNADNYRNWYLKDENTIVFAFPHYSIGAYALGTYEIEVLISEIK